MFWIYFAIILVVLALCASAVFEYADEIEIMWNEAKYMWNDRKRLRVE